MTRSAATTAASAMAAFVLASTALLGVATAAPVPHVIADPGEPGEPLTLVIRVVDARTGAPVGDAELLLYHADDDGAYQPRDPADASTARLRAEGRADAAGAFAVRTVLPGEYPGQPPGNRHVHIEYVRAPGFAPFGGVILFEHNVNDTVRDWARATGFGRVIELVPDDGGWRGTLTIELEPTR